MKKKMMRMTLAAILAMTMCSGAALACCQSEIVYGSVAEGASPLYCHTGGHHGGRHGGHGHHGSTEACSWLFHVCGDCVDVNCQEEDHAHRCPVDCKNVDHQHYSVCRNTDGTLSLMQKNA